MSTVMLDEGRLICERVSYFQRLTDGLASDPTARTLARITAFIQSRGGPFSCLVKNAQYSLKNELEGENA